MLHLVSEVGFANSSTSYRSLKMVTKTLEELTRHELQKTLRIWNQSVGGSEAELLQRFTECQQKEEYDSATYTFEVENIESTTNLLQKILENITLLSAKAGQQHAKLSTKSDQQQGPFSWSASHICISSHIAHRVLFLNVLGWSVFYAY